MMTGIASGHTMSASAKILCIVFSSQSRMYSPARLFNAGS